MFGTINLGSVALYSHYGQQTDDTEQEELLPVTLDWKIWAQNLTLAAN